MVVWMLAVSLAAVVFFQGDNFFFLMFSDTLKNDSWGLATAFIKSFAPWVKYLLIGMILFLAYGIRNKQSMRLQATVMGAPRCPRCERRMVFRTAGLGFSFGNISGIVQDILFAMAGRKLRIGRIKAMEVNVVYSKSGQ